MKYENLLSKIVDFEPLAADILLLGGDDLLVALPAHRALDFALQVTKVFEHLTQEKIDCPTREYSGPAILPSSTW